MYREKKKKKKKEKREETISIWPLTCGNYLEWICKR